MDAGAYATLSAWSCRAARSTRRPVPLPERPDPRRSMVTNTPRTARSAASGTQVEFAARCSQSGRRALGISPAELGAAGLPGRRRHADGQVLRESVARRASGAAVEASGFEVRASGRGRADRAGTGDPRSGCVFDHVAHGVGLALGWHGRASPAAARRPWPAARRWRPRSSRRPRRGVPRGGAPRRAAALDGGRPVVRVLTASTRIGQGMRTVFTQLVADTWRSVRRRGIGPQTRRSSEQRPTVASRTTMVIGGLLVDAPSFGSGRRSTAGRSPPRGATDSAPGPQSGGRALSFPASSGTSDVPRRRLPVLQLGAAWRPWTWISIRARSRSDPSWRGRRRTHRQPRARGRPGPGRNAPGGRYATIEEMKVEAGGTSTTGWRPMSSRRGRRAGDHGAVRRGAVRRRSARRERPRRAADGRPARRSSPRSTTRPGSGSTSSRPRRSGSSPRSSSRGGRAEGGRAE